MNQYTYLNQKTHLTIRTETFREFLEFHLDRAEAAEQAMEIFPGSISPEGISEHRRRFMLPHRNSSITAPALSEC